MPNRRNTVDDDGNEWYVYDSVRERVVYGPFGSRDYAETVRDRAVYPYEELDVGSKRRLA